MPNQSATRDVVDLVTRPITQGIDVDGDNSVNFQIDGTRIGLSSAAAAAFTTITMSGALDMAGQRINNVSTPMAGTDGVNRDYVTTADASTLSAANAYTDSQVGGIPPIPDSVPSGSIIMTGRATAPTGWLLCDGSAVSETTYADLFAAIGYAYGNPGGGMFNLPNLSGRFPAGAGNSGTTGATTLSLGDSGGTARHQLSLGEMPTHSHGAGSLRAAVGPSGGGADATYGVASSFTTSTQIVGATANAGSSQTHENMPPLTTVNYIIKT